MSINKYEVFKSRIKFYEFLYVFLIINIIFIVLIGLLHFKNIEKVNFKGIVSNNILEINNLSEYEIKLFLESKKILVLEKEIKKEIIDINEINNKYFVKIKLDEITTSLEEEKVICILKDEKLYQFIINIMKGDI